MKNIKIISNLIIILAYLFTMCSNHPSNSTNSLKVEIKPILPTTYDTLKCYVSGGSGHYNFLWKKDGMEIEGPYNFPIVNPKWTCLNETWSCVVKDRTNETLFGSDDVWIY